MKWYIKVLIIIGICFGMVLIGMEYDNFLLLLALLLYLEFRIMKKELKKDKKDL